MPLVFAFPFKADRILGTCDCSLKAVCLLTIRSLVILLKYLLAFVLPDLIFDYILFLFSYFRIEFA